MKTKLFNALSLAVIMAMLITNLALADNVENDIVTAPASITLQAGNAASYVDVQFYVQPTGGDSDPQCNFDTTSEKVTFTINTPSDVTANPSSLTFNKCHDGGNFNYQTVRFAADSLAESGNVSFTETFNNSGGTFNYANAVFYINITTPPPSDTTAPTASPNQSPVANANGWNNSDVTVTWNWTDEDGGSGIDSANCTTETVATAEGEYNVTATCKDLAGNTGSASYGVKIDKTAPTISGSASPAANGAGWNNSDVAVTFTCDDNLSGVASCGPDATLTGEGGGQSVAGTAVDNAGNSASTTVSPINIDKTKPTISAAATTSPNAAGWYKSDVTVEFTCGDSLSGIPAGTCPADETLSTEGHAVSSTAQTVTDAAGNTSDPSNVVTVKIDKTAPTLTWDPGMIADGGSFYFGFAPSYPSNPCVAADTLSGPNGCSTDVQGYATTVDTHSVTATAYDVAGNSYSESRSYTVLAWELKGFYQPVDMSGVFNSVKGGSTVPLKFEIFAGSTELTDVTYVASFRYGPVACNASAPNDEIETLATGATSLRYDWNSGQFIYNWKTPKTTGCFSVTMMTQDGSTLVAYFKLK